MILLSFFTPLTLLQPLIESERENHEPEDLSGLVLRLVHMEYLLSLILPHLTPLTLTESERENHEPEDLPGLALGPVHVGYPMHGGVLSEVFQESVPAGHDTLLLCLLLLNLHLEGLHRSDVLHLFTKPTPVSHRARLVF